MKQKTIYQTKSGKFLVIEADDGKAVVCKIIKAVSPRHRADYSLSYASSITAGTNASDVVACIPSVVTISKGFRAVGHVSSEDFDKIRALAYAEAKTAAQENNTRSRVSSVYRW